MNDPNKCSQLRNPNVVNLIAYTINPFCLAMDLAPQGNLYNLLHSAKSLSLHYRLKVANDIAKGVASMHRLNPPLVHCDLKRQISKRLILAAPTV